MQNGNILYKYVCGAFFKNKPWFYNLLGKNKAWVDNRIDDKFDYNKISSFKIYDILYRLIGNSRLVDMLNTKGNVDLFFNYIFDLYCSYQLNFAENITHFHYVSSVGHRSAIKAKKKFGCAIIIDERAEHKEFLYNILKEEYKILNLDFKDKEFWTIDTRRDYEIADYIVVPSKYCKYTFENQGISEKKLVVIPYGCDLSKFYPTQVKDDGIFKVISVGTICARKGIHYLIDAFKQLKYKNVELILVGKVEKEFEYILDNLPKNIKHIPYVPNSELNELYSKSDVFVLPSLSDSFSLATIEAMASGVTVIVSENVGAKDFVVQGENGYIVPIRDSAMIKEKLELLYNNRNKTEHMGKCARKTVLNLSWDEYGKKLINFYESIK
jgi:glycosyltransferase involved in cell wall biosynthesis